MIRIITNKALVHHLTNDTKLLIGRRYCYEGRRYGRIFIGKPKVWGPVENVISTHAELVEAMEDH